jgi:hypothetical protein
MLKEVKYIDPISTMKVGALLGILWAVLAWLFQGIIISMMPADQMELQGEIQAFSLVILLSEVLGSVLGGALSGYLGSLFYNFIVTRMGGGIIVIMQDYQKSAKPAHGSPVAKKSVEPSPPKPPHTQQS